MYKTLNSGPAQELNAGVREEIDALGGPKAALSALAKVCLTLQCGVHDGIWGVALGVGSLASRSGSTPLI